MTGGDENDLEGAVDDDPTAGASDIGGRAGGQGDDDDEDAREPGGGHTGMGKGPTGS